MEQPPRLLKEFSNLVAYSFRKPFELTTLLACTPLELSSDRRSVKDGRTPRRHPDATFRSVSVVTSGKLALLQASVIKR